MTKLTVMEHLGIWCVAAMVGCCVFVATIKLLTPTEKAIRGRE